jgi:hypothetical protein
MTKKIIITLILFYFLFYFSGCAANNNLSHKTINHGYTQDFPSSSYITAHAGGKTLTDAMMQAKAEIAGMFESRIMSDLSSRAESVIDRSGNESFSKTVKTNIQIVSCAKIQGMEIKKTWFDKNSGTWHALAVLDRHKSKSIWDQEIEEIDSKIKALLNTKKTSDIVRLVSLKKIAKLWIARESVAIRLKIAGFSDSGFKDFDIRQFFDELTAVHSGLRIYIQITGDKHKIIKEYISQAFSAKGFVLTDNREDADTFITGTSNVGPVQIQRRDNVKFARAEILLTITDLYGNKVLEIVKNKRAAHQNYDEAAYKAVKKCSEIIAGEACNLNIE